LILVPKKSRMNITKTDPTSEWMTQQDVANLFHITVVTVHTWIKQDRLPAYRFGPKMIRIKRSDVEALIAPLPTTLWPGATMQKLDDIRRALGALNVSPMPDAVPPHPNSREGAEVSGPRVNEQEVAPPMASAPEPLA
jgi:excisionase family DNA binding protein